MEDKLRLALPNRKQIDSKTQKLNLFLLSCVFCTVLINLFFTFYTKKEQAIFTHSALSPQGTKELALKLEKRKLNEISADIWKEYLKISKGNKKEQAKVWYRIGKLYQENGSYSKALEAYYRSESISHISEVESDINRRIQESLESLGKFAALRYELNDRVDMEENKDDSGMEVLAEIGSEKITKSDLDHLIEKQIERQLSSMKALIPPDQFGKQKESLLKRFSIPKERIRILNQIILEEILYRKAREDRLTEDSDIRQELKDAERSILAQNVMVREVSDKINITEGDLKRYYDNSKQEKSFEETRPDIYSDLKAEKEREISKVLIADLRERYNVVIHTSKFSEQ